MNTLDYAGKTLSSDGKKIQIAALPRAVLLECDSCMALADYILRVDEFTSPICHCCLQENIESPMTDDEIV